MDDDLGDFLAHYGVKGMRWGKRSGGLADRKKGAALDLNQRRSSQISRIQKGKGTLLEKAYVAPDKLLMGKKQHAKMLDKRLVKLAKQRERIESGKATIIDKFDAAMSTSVLDLVVSRTEYEK